MLFQNIPTWARFQWINDPNIVKILLSALPYAGTGRRGYGRALLFRWMLYKQCHRCTYRDVESMSGIDYTTLIKFRAVMKQNNRLEYIFQTIVSVITDKESLTLITDSSFVEQYARKKEAGAEYSGFKEKTGFKVHQIIDWRTRLPVAKIVTGGARSDIVLAKALVKELPDTWNVTAFLADKGYDGNELVQQLKHKWSNVAVGIPVRRTCQKTLGSKRQETQKNKEAKRNNRTLTPSLYNKRTEIERYFSRKKYVFNLGQEHTRGIENFNYNCALTDVAAQLEFLSKPARGHFSPSSVFSKVYIQPFVRAALATRSNHSSH